VQYKLALVGLALALAVTGCGSTRPNRDPAGEIFPSVEGTALSGESWRIPEDLAGDRAILLIGYKQDSQFDIDRWLIAFAMVGVSTRVLELPTIEGLAPGVFSGQIDSGMRSGIPQPVWEAVVTIYGDAPAVLDFTGNTDPLNARVLVLDQEGRVVWFHDRGFSVLDLEELLQHVQTDGPGLAIER
jgi:hypothetical protein